MLLWDSLPSLCNFLYPPFFFSFVFKLGCWFFFFGFHILWFPLLAPCYSTSTISHSNYCYHTVCFFITLLFVFYVFSLFFALLWRTWEGSIHLFYNVGNGREQEVFREFQSGKWSFRYLRISRVLFSSLFSIWFFNRDLLRRPVFLISSTHASDWERV